ncbi:MAG: helix-turn-helix domain-containing protein [Magnetovibrio sp.]|nr:helix-turn-helix domain-containing protein [Magnetovibrio sp.]
MTMSTPSSEIFAQRLKEARELRGLSQTELAKRSNLQPSAISHFETKTRRPSFENLRKLADALDVTTDYLLGRVDDAQALGAADKLHRHINELSIEDRSHAEDMLELLAKRARERRKQED